MINLIIEYEVNPKNKEELQLADEFCKYIVKNIREEIYNNMIPDKMNLLEKDILEASWIYWTRGKPKNINVTKLIKYILNNLWYRKRGRTRYAIVISSTHYIPGTYVTPDAMARFLDKGNEVTPCTTFISRVFNKYRDNINDYWKSYVSKKLGVYEVSELVLIR